MQRHKPAMPPPQPKSVRQLHISLAYMEGATSFSFSASETPTARISDAGLLEKIKADFTSTPFVDVRR